MGNKMEDQKGFIQVPLFTTIILGILFLGGVGYLGVKKYLDSHGEKIQIQQQVQIQQKVLEQAQSEIEKLKQGLLEQKIYSQQQESETRSFSVSTTEINKYIDGVVLVRCVNSEGSGFLMNLDNGYTVITNDHVISGNDNCGAMPYDSSGKNLGYFDLDLTSSSEWNSYTDITILKMNIIPALQSLTKPISSLNYNLSGLRLCPTKMASGFPVVIVGYPAFGKHILEDGRKYDVPVSTRQVTEGVISSYYESIKLPYSNYYVSAKIDSGNSGGIALSKDSKGLCLLGVTTWLSVGNFETQGIVQNIHNVFRKE